jgi:hypothetical protein
MFKANEIDKILSAKREIESFLNDCVTKAEWAKIIPWSLFNNNTYITGGAIASLIQGEKPKDYDFYFKDAKTMKSFLGWFSQNNTGGIMAHVKDVDEKYKNIMGKNGKMITANAITLTNDASFITKWWGEPGELRKKFDYVHCLPYYDLKTKELYISEKQYEAIINKRLIVNNPESVVDSRKWKFEQRGYK